MFLGFLHLVYLIFEFIFILLININSLQGIYGKKWKLFHTPFQILFLNVNATMILVEKNIKAYPNVTPYNDLNKKIISYKEMYKLPYYTERDTIGLFNLNLGTSNIKKKYYNMNEIF